MKKYSFLLSVLSTGLFFWLATATSLPEHPVNLKVEIIDTILILNNEEDLDFDNAILSLSYFDRIVARPNGFIDSIYKKGCIYDYSIRIGETDTINFSEFLGRDSLPFPVDSIPIFFDFEGHAGFKAVFRDTF